MSLARVCSEIVTRRSNCTRRPLRKATAKECSTSLSCTSTTPRKARTKKNSKRLLDGSVPLTSRTQRLQSRTFTLGRCMSRATVLPAISDQRSSTTGEVQSWTMSSLWSSVAIFSTAGVECRASEPNRVAQSLFARIALKLSSATRRQARWVTLVV